MLVRRSDGKTFRASHLRSVREKRAREYGGSGDFYADKDLVNSLDTIPPRWERGDTLTIGKSSTVWTVRLVHIRHDGEAVHPLLLVQAGKPVGARGATRYLGHNEQHNLNRLSGTEYRR